MGFAVLVKSIQVIGRHDAVHRDDRATAAERMDIAVIAVAGEAHDLSGPSIDSEDRVFERIFSGHEEAPTVFGPLDRADRAVPGLCQRTNLSRRRGRAA